MKRRIAFAALLASASYMPSCSQEETFQNPPTPVRVAQVVTYESASEIRYSATITPYTQVNVDFKSGGYVQSIRQVKGADGRTRDLQQGDYISAGTVLAQVRPDDYVIGVDRAKKQLEQAQWSLETARAQHSKAEAALTQARLDHTRAQNLLAAQSLTKSDYDAAKARLDADQASVAAAKGQIDAVQAQVGASEQAVKAAELSLADATLKSPLDGTVLKRSVEMGTLANPGTTGFVIADITSVKAVFDMPDTMLERVRLGTAQVITAEAVTGEFKGIVTAISPAADPKSRAFSIEISIPNPRRQLKPGMIAALVLTGASVAPPVPVIPLSAVIRAPQDAGGFAVFIVEDQGGKSVARVRKVELGEAYGNVIGVKAGLEVAERVITTGATLVKDGGQVEVIR